MAFARKHFAVIEISCQCIYMNNIPATNSMMFVVPRRFFSLGYRQIERLDSCI